MKNKEPAEIAITAIAWAQLLVSISIVNIPNMSREILDSGYIALIDFRMMGALAIALNIISLVLLTMPLLAWKVWNSEGERIELRRKAATLVGEKGLVFWILSFVVLLMHIHVAFGILAFLSVFIVVLYTEKTEERLAKEETLSNTQENEG